MSVWKAVIVLIIVGVIGLVAYDAVEIANAHRDVSNTASAAAGAAANAISSTKDRAKAASIAASTAKSHGDVVTTFSYDPVTAKVTVTVSGKASSLVIHYFDRNLTDNIKASATARPG